MPGVVASSSSSLHYVGWPPEGLCSDCYVELSQCWEQHFQVTMKNKKSYSRKAVHYMLEIFLFTQLKNKPMNSSVKVVT
ncbi:hypothetical protein AAY473_012819 [Plecturocebus cupreus]